METTERRFKIELSEKQLKVIQLALAEYYELASNQWGALANRLVLSQIEVDASKTRYEMCIQTRNDVHTVFETAGRIMIQNGVRRNLGNNELIAHDIWNAIQQGAWKQPKEEASAPFAEDNHRSQPVSGLPFPKIEMMEECYEERCQNL